MSEDNVPLLTKVIEELFLSNVALVTMIMTFRQHFPKIGDWETDFEKLKAECRQQPAFRQKWAEIAQALSQATQTHEEILELLKGFRSDVIH